MSISWHILAYLCGYLANFAVHKVVDILWKTCGLLGYQQLFYSIETNGNDFR